MSSIHWPSAPHWRALDPEHECSPAVHWAGKVVAGALLEVAVDAAFPAAPVAEGAAIEPAVAAVEVAALVEIPPEVIALVPAVDALMPVADCVMEVSADCA